MPTITQKQEFRDKFIKLYVGALILNYQEMNPKEIEEEPYNPLPEHKEQVHYSAPPQQIPQPRTLPQRMLPPKPLQPINTQQNIPQKPAEQPPQPIQKTPETPKQKPEEEGFKPSILQTSQKKGKPPKLGQRLVKPDISQIPSTLPYEQKRPAAQPQQYTPQTLPQSQIQLEQQMTHPQMKPPQLPPYSPPKPGETINLGKVTQFLLDPAVISVEVPGPDKNILVNRSGKIQVSPESLTKQEIEKIMHEISEKTRIPLSEGVIKTAVQDLIITAVLSDFVGTRFIIQKRTPMMRY